MKDGFTANALAGQVQVFPMPASGPGPVVSAIQSARTSIDLSIYQLSDYSVIDALKAAAQRGVTVRVMIEPNPISDNNQPSTFPQQKADLESAGIQVLETPPPFDTKTFPSPDVDNHNVDHAKFFVVDGNQLWFGTGNLVRSGLGDGTKFLNRDFWMQDTRPAAVGEAEALFSDDWNRKDSTSSVFPDLVVSPDNARADLVSLIDGAKTRLYVYNQMFRDPGLINHIIAAKQRGVDVKVLAAGPYSPGEADGNAKAIAQFQQAGIPVEELTKLYLHAKVVIADDQAFVGSQNFTMDAMNMNRELGEITPDPKVVQTLVQTFQSDFASPKAADEPTNDS